MMILIQERKNKIYHLMIKFDASPGGEIGRHKGLKIPRRKLRAGSSPALGTKLDYNERYE